MNEKIIGELYEIITIHWDNIYSRSDVKKKINAKFNNKKTSTVIFELNNYIQSISGQNKNRYVLIVSLALLRRNLNCIQELKEQLEKYNLISLLFGGLSTFLSGTSKEFTIPITWDYDRYENKYEILYQFHGFKYFEYIELFQAIKTIYYSKPDLIEKLIKKDKTKLILLNLSEHLNITVSDSLISYLLNDSDEFNNNIGFYLLTTPITILINKIDCIDSMKQFQKRLSKDSYNEKQKCLNDLKENIERVEKFINNCHIKTKISLLINYALTNIYYSRSNFVCLLMEADIQKEFIDEINCGKIKTLEQLNIITQLISKTPIKNNHYRKTKNLLFNSIINIIINFIKSRTGIYLRENNEVCIFHKICKAIPKKYKRNLLSFLKKESATLMASKFDELVRFTIYLKDNQKKSIINGMIKIIENEL